jgi:outer membrane protein OmpA-like peptidoglycan-associated protein
MIGTKAGVNYSTDEILTFEGQVYLRWNFLRLGSKNTTNIFLQGGLGLLSAYRGIDNPFDDVTLTRGSLLADAALGLTIPLSSRWHIEPLIRGGYPHILGFSISVGYKFPMPYAKQKAVEVVRNITAKEIIRIIEITAIEFILFGPDIGDYNAGIDRDAQQLNELVLDATAKMLKENSDYAVRIEGHANPLTVTQSRADSLMTLSNTRSNTVAQELRKRGVSNDQMFIAGYGGTRNATNEWDLRNRNRRVELIILRVDPKQI